MSNDLTMNDLYNKLEKLGLSKEFIRAIGLPSWWVDELDQSSSYSVMLEGACYISTRLLIDLKSLISTTEGAKFIDSTMTCEQLVEVLKQGKRHLLGLRTLGMQVISNDSTDYFEQLLTLEF